MEIATFTGFDLALPTAHRGFPFLLLAHTLLGTMLLAGGAATLHLR